MNPVVIDASAGVELVADTVRGRELRKLIRPGATPWVPDLFYGECGAVLRRWELRRVLTPSQTVTAVDALLAWPLRVVQTRGLFPDAWRYRANITFADGVYVALAQHLGAELLTSDYRLANAPNLPVRSLVLPPMSEPPTI